MSIEASPFLNPNRPGPLSIGSSLNLVFFTIEVLQAAIYFRGAARRHDGAFIKLGVAVNLVADLAGTVVCCATTYLYLTIYWGQPEGLEKQHWSLTVVLFTVGVVTAVSQFFMISRYWQMTKQHVVFALLLIILGGAVAGIFGCGVLMTLSQTDKGMLLDAFLFLALLASGVGNLLISLLSFWRLCERNSTPVTRWNFPQRILSALIETGTITTAVTIVGSAISFGKVRDTMIWIIFAFIHARVYSCTMLFVLLNRPESASAVKGNAFEAVNTITDNRAVSPVTFVSMPPVTLMEDADAFRLTKKRIELHERQFDSDSSSDVSRNLNDELREIQEHGSPRASCSSMGNRSEVMSRSESPSEYPMSPSARGLSPFPISPMMLSPRSASPA
ncbi:hypothetical protein DFH09DRAFT_1299433 [Mycena vulgaris]|nr:hypothetical protein DFH09DRAFT_1299433 [Mycena vulgaris]